VLARAAKEAGALVLAFVTMPFECEGNRRQRQAKKGLEELKAEADGVICLPNQKILKLVDENSSVVETFKASNTFMTDGVNGVWRLMARKGLIEIHFADLCALLRSQRGENCFATSEAVGPTRSREALEKLFAHPMLDNGKVLADSEAVLVSLTSGANLTMAEVNRVMEHINGKCSKAQIIMGAAIDESFNDRLAITLVVSRRSASVKRTVAEEASDEAAQMNEQLLDEESTPRPQSRIVPPPPEVSPEKAQQILTRTGTRGKNKSPKWRQTHLELEIVAKGRFDKSEPTIHKGEDLDVPTYIRRGISLN
jgi:cell division protein FtsZ